MTSSRTVRLSTLRAAVCWALCALGLPALAAAVPDNVSTLPALAAQSDLAMQAQMPSLVFFRKDSKGGGGGSGRSGTGSGGDDDGKGEKEGKKDGKGKDGQKDKKKDEKKDKDKDKQKDKKKDKRKDEKKDKDKGKDENGKDSGKGRDKQKDKKKDKQKDKKKDKQKDKKKDKQKGDRKDKGKDKQKGDRKDKGKDKQKDTKEDEKKDKGKKAKDSQKDNKKDGDKDKNGRDSGEGRDKQKEKKKDEQKDKGRDKQKEKNQDEEKDRGKKAKYSQKDKKKDRDKHKYGRDSGEGRDKKNDTKKNDSDGGESGERDERESGGDQHDHDRNERHDHDNETARGRHDHETEERRYEHRDHQDTGERNEDQVSAHEHEAGQGAPGAEAGNDATANSEDTPAEASHTEPPPDETNAQSNTVPGAVTLSWTPPVENEDGSTLMDLAGYRVFWRKTSWDHTESLQIDNPGLSRVVIEGLDAGTYEFAMTSLNSAGIESDLSNSVTRIIEGPVSPAAGEADAATSERTISPSDADSAAEPSPHLMISGIPPEAVTAGELYLFSPVVESNGELPPAFAIEGLPHWAGFDGVTGELYGTPADADLGLYEAITISATDGVVETSLPTFSIEVVAPGAARGAVTLSWTPPTENNDGTYLVDLAGYWIYWGQNPGTYTEWLRIDNPGLTTVVIEDLVPGGWEFAMTSFNEDGVESKLSNTVTRFVE